MATQATQEATELKHQFIDLMTQSYAELQDVGVGDRQTYMCEQGRRVGELLVGKSIFAEAVGSRRKSGMLLSVVEPSLTYPRFLSYFKGSYIGGDFNCAVIEAGAIIISREERGRDFKHKRHYKVPVIGADAEGIELTIS